MPIEKLGVNISAINNIDPINISISTNPNQLISDIVTNANVSTQNMWAFGGLLSTFAMLFYTFTSTENDAKFRFSPIRGMTIAFGICAMLGSVLIEIGLTYSIYSVSFFLFAFVLSAIIIIAMENK